MKLLSFAGLMASPYVRSVMWPKDSGVFKADTLNLDFGMTEV